MLLASVPFPILWKIDSTATSYISSKSSSFALIQLIQSSPAALTVTLANGNKVLISGVGLIRSISSLILPSTCYIPSAPFNLIFASQLTKHLNCCVCFFLDSIVI